MKLRQLAVLLPLAYFASTLPLPAQTPDPLDALRRQIRALQAKKALTRSELERLLATTLKSPYHCPTGELWPAFEAGAPHTPATVLILLDLYREHPDRWKRYHLLTALSREPQPFLRPFWLGLLSDPELPADYRWSVIRGIGRTGTDADVAARAVRLGSGRDWESAILWLLEERPQPRARAAILERFRDGGAPGYIRAQALRALAKLGGPELPRYIAEAAADESEEVRQAAAALMKRP